MNLYACAGNDAIGLSDYLGLAWQLTRRPQYGWAIAIPDAETDTFEQLASKVHLDYNERTLWLRRGGSGIDASEKPKKGCRYGIPNSIFVDLGKLRMRDKMAGIIPTGLSAVESLRKAARDAGATYTTKGYRVVVTGPPTTQGDLLGHLQAEDAYGYIFAGHGADGAINTAGNEGYDELIAQRYRNAGQRHGLAFLALLACQSAKTDQSASRGKSVYKYNAWELNVSSSGTFMGFTGVVHTWDAMGMLISTPGLSNFPLDHGLDPLHEWPR